VGLERLGYGFRVRVSRAGETVREACGVAVDEWKREDEVGFSRRGGD
jgi:hypothetical protein